MQRIIQIVLGILLAISILYWLVQSQVLNDASSPNESPPQDTVPEAAPLSPDSPSPDSVGESPTPTPTPAPTPAPTPTPTPAPTPTPTPTPTPSPSHSCPLVNPLILSSQDHEP
ncbi:hypothetical protein E1H12_03435 [Geitlerinema sp. P-1104]|nr:hypothetical protein [Geitlerinema sp. P-1104]